MAHALGKFSTHTLQLQSLTTSVSVSVVFPSMEATA
jgi:hypothetical protein